MTLDKIMESIFNAFKITGPYLRKINITTKMVEGVQMLVIFETFDAPSTDGTPTTGREINVENSIEVLGIAKLLISLVEFERKLILSCTMNIKNFKFLGVFSNDFINMESTVFNVANDLKVFKEFLSFSINTILGMFIKTGTDNSSSFASSIIRISKNDNVLLSENRSYIRKLCYIGKEFETVPEMFQVTMDSAYVAYLLNVKYTSGNAVPTIVVNIPIEFNIHKSIYTISEMPVVGDSMIIPVEDIESFDHSLQNDFIVTTLKPEIEVKESFKEVYGVDDTDVRMVFDINNCFKEPKFEVFRFERVNEDVDGGTSTPVVNVTPTISQMSIGNCTYRVELSVPRDILTVNEENNGRYTYTVEAITETPVYIEVGYRFKTELVHTPTPLKTAKEKKII
ncbi:MAG: hypothetical protein ACRCX8_04970 [Sarcina sp.]